MSPNQIPVVESSSERRGILAMLGAMACLAMNDALVKVASESMPISQIFFIRGFCAISFLLAFAVVVRAPLWHKAIFDRRVVMRASADALISITYVYGLKHLHYANVAAISMSAPFILTIFAVVLFEETVTPRRWLTIFAGLGGVLLIVQPASDAFNGWSLLVFLSAIFMACRDLLTKVMRQDIPLPLLTLTNVTMTTVLGAVWGTGQEWMPLANHDIGILAAASIVMSFGYILLASAMRSHEVGTVAPFRYSTLVFSALIGYVVWDYIPNTLAWCGMALIIVSGLAAQSKLAPANR